MIVQVLGVDGASSRDPQYVSDGTHRSPPEKHAEPETELDDQNSRPIPDTEAIADLKRQKLAIKDELAKLSTGQPATFDRAVKARRPHYLHL